jgi:hypothetical protein
MLNVKKIMVDKAANFNGLVIRDDLEIRYFKELAGIVF